jgi:predicted phosphodiesterase
MNVKLHKDRITRVLVLPDIHFPTEDTRTMGAVEKYMAEHEWDVLVYLGDVMDFNCISSHNKHNLRAVEGQSLAKDYEYANACLEYHAGLVGPGCQLIYIQGNHDERVERLVDANPQLRGQVEVEKNIRLIKDKRMSFVKFWQKGEVVKIGKATFIHGVYVNEFSAKTHVLNYGTNLFFGHNHQIQTYPKTWAGAETIVGQSLGCLCGMNPGYLKGTPNRWTQAFGVFFFVPNGNFTYYVPMIFNHKFVGPDGKEYAG